MTVSGFTIVAINMTVVVWMPGAPAVVGWLGSVKVPQGNVTMVSGAVTAAAVPDKIVGKVYDSISR